MESLVAVADEVPAIELVTFKLRFTIVSKFHVVNHVIMHVLYITFC